MTTLLLDTHAWIWLAAGDERLRRSERALTRAAGASSLLLSAASVYEAGIIGIETDEGRRRGKQAVRMRPTVESWLRDTLRATHVVVSPLDADMAIAATTFHAMHADPFDRMIVATAVQTNAHLVTADSKIREFAKSAGVKLVEI